MARPLTNAWRDKAFFYDAPIPLHVADPRHQTLGHEVGPGEYAHEAPPYPYAMPVGDENFGSQNVLDSGGLVIDSSPITHDTGAEWGMEYTGLDDLAKRGGADADFLQTTHRIHGLDQGGSKARNYSEKVPQFSDEKYLAFRIPGLGVEAGDPIPPESGGGQRGLNGLSVNNPPLESYGGEGFARGTTEQVTVDRKFYARIIQRHDERAWMLNLPWFETDAPAAKPGNQSTSPFSALQRVVAGVVKIPLSRRTPPVPGDIQSELVTEDVTSPVIEAGFYG